jgi:uncharacterized membrane protein
VKRLSFLGHPIHPALVHVPMALLPLSFVMQAWAAASNDALVVRMAVGGLVIGLLGSIPALVTGFIDFSALPDGHPAERIGEAHLLAMSVALGCFFGAWFTLRGPDTAITWVPLACSGAGTLALLLGGWCGGQLVYYHGVGRD